MEYPASRRCHWTSTVSYLPAANWEASRAQTGRQILFHGRKWVAFRGGGAASWVDLGSVTSVRVRPESKDAPVEIVMALKTGYELNIPNDSTASLETAGVLGQTFVEIDSHTASGPPIQSGSTLKAQPTASLTTEEMIAKFATAFNLSTAEALEKLESRIKERCDGEKVQSGVTNKRPASKARPAN